MAGKTRNNTIYCCPLSAALTVEQLELVKAIQAAFGGLAESKVIRLALLAYGQELVESGLVARRVLDAACAVPAPFVHPSKKTKKKKKRR